MAGISLEQYREAEKRNRVIEANEFFASASTVGKNITDTLNNGGGNGNIGKQRIQSANLLKQAQRMRQMYANEGNKKMVKNIDLATNYLNNVNSHLDSVLSPETTIKEAFSDATPTIPTQNNKTLNKFQKINYNIYNQNRNLSFDELNDKQAQYKREGKPEIYNQILEGLKSEKATDNDYKNAVETAKSRIKELDTGDDEGSRAYKQYMKMQNDNSAHGRYAKESLKRNHENSEGWKRAAEIDKYNDIINQYGDYAKYGKTNTEVWKQSVDGMSYKDKSDYINKLKTNEYEQQLQETIDKYPSGKEYISSLSGGEKPTAQGFLTWMEDNNKGFYSEQRGYEKNTNSNHMDVSTARNNLLNLDKKVKQWEQNSEERNNQIEYLDKYAKSTIQDNYEDYKALYDEYENKFDNSKSQSEQQDLALDFQKNYNQKYMELKQEHNYNLLDDQDKTELNRIVTSGADDTTLYDNLKKKYGFNNNEADAVVGYAEAKNNEEIAKQQQEEYREFGRKHPVTGTITSVPMSLTGGIGAVSNTWDRLKQAFGSERAIDWNNAPNRVSKNTQELREGVKDDINNELGNFVYDAFASTLDSAATIPLNMLVPGATTILLGSSAASSAMIDAHDKGASDSNAIMTGVGAGIFEGLFEKVSLDKLIDVSKNMTKKGLKNVLKGVAKSSMIEGSEEGFTEFANILWDSAVNGDLSDYGIALQQYMEQGMSESEAKKQTDKDMAKRIAMNVGGGMLGGLFFSMPAAGYGHVRNKANFEITNKGENIIKHNKNTELKEYIEDNYDKSSEVYQLMKNTDLENPGEVGYLSNAVELSEYQNSIQKFDEAMVPAVKSRLEELNVPESDATELAVKTIQNIGNRKDIDAGPYKEAYDQIKRDIREKNKGVSVEWLDNVDLTGQAEHIDKMKKIAGLSEGKSLKTEKQQEVQKQQEQLENNVNENVAEKMNEGRVVENGKASLVSDEDTKFNILSLAVGTDGRTKVNTDTRQTYDIDDVIVDRKTAELSEFANQYEGKDRQKFFRSYEENRNLSPAKFAMYYNEAYRYGNENLGIESALKNQRLTNVLNTDAIARAFDSGKAEYKQKIEQSRVITNNNNKGKVVFDNVAPEMLNDTQRAAVDLANTLSDVTGVTYEFFESKKNENGKYQGENGSYNRKENKIRIDINAGMISSTEGNNLMVVTLAHELTHYAENLAPAEYANLQEFVFNKLSDETGKSIEQLIADEIKNRGEKISEDVAKSELVARGCEAMLTDSESIKSLAKQDVGLFKKIKAKIDDFCNKIIKACKEILNSDGSIKDSAISKEAQMMQKYAQELRKLWSSAVKSAGESNTFEGADTTSMLLKDRNKYPYNMQTVIQDYIDSVDEKIKKDYEDVINGNVKFKRNYINDVSEKQANDFNRLTGIDVRGYTNNINTNAYVHINQRHGAEGVRDTTMSKSEDVARMKYVIENYDNAELVTKKGGETDYSIEFRDKKDRPAKMVKLSKKINGVYYVVITSADNKFKKLWVVSSYIEKGVTQALDVQAPRSDVRNALASPPNESISQNNKNDNDILKQDRNTDSSREILATALESTIKNDTERQYIKNYRDNIDKLYDLDKKLDVVNGALKEMYFMPGNKPTSTIKDLQKQANGIRIQMKRYENNLLKLESTKTLKNFVERENKAAATKQRHIDAQKLKEYRTKQNERFDRMQKRYQDAAKQKVENRKRIEARNKVIKRVDKLNKWLKKPNNKKYIPAKFMNGTVNLLQGLNQDVMNVAQRLDEVRSEMAGYTEVPQNLVNKYTTLLEKNKQLKERTEALSKFYKAIETDPDYAGNYSQTVMDQIDKMKETVKDKPIGAMNVQELNVVKDTIDLLTNEIKKWNETLDTKFIDGEENEMNIKEISDKAYKELVQRKKVNDNVAQSFLNMQLSPTRMFKRIGGYAKNGVWEQLGEMLNDGQRDKLRYEQGAAAIFDKVTSNRTDKSNQKNLARLKKEKVDIGLVDEEGKPVEITKGMMLSVYKHLLNEENLRHAMYGGFTIPEFKDYYKGNRSKSYAQNKTRALGVSAELAQLGQKIQKAYDHGATDVEIAELESGHEEIIERGKMQMAKIKNTIEEIIQGDEYLKKWIDCSSEYFDKYSKDAINEVTMKRYSMKKAGVDNYFPIHTDSNYLAKGKEGKGSRAVNLENSGFMQDRVKSTKPIYLEDITNVVNDSISGTGTYVGFLIPQYNYNRILGYTAEGYKTNIKNALELRLGQQATNYLSNLEKDLFGGRSGDGSWSSRIMSKARGKVAQSALTLNIPVTAGQAASYFTAAPTVGWKNLAKAFAKGGKHGLVISSADRELINKYSPLLWYRNLGNVSQDIHDAKNADGVYNKINDKTNGYLFGWIQKADVATVGRLWYAAQYYVSDNFKDLEKGSDEYYKQTAKVFNKIVEETQPNYTVMQRPGVLRSQNEMVKALTMFSTQRMQNYNILFDSIATARRYRQDFKNGLNGVTAEDVKQANRTARRAVTSQIVSAAVLGIMKTAAALMLLQWKNFGDDENEFRKENVLKYGLDQFYSNVAGTIVGGSELYSFVSSIVNKSAYYGISLTGFDAITEFVSEIQDYALRLRTDEVSAKDTEKLIRNFSVVMGIPYAQAKKIYEGTTGWTKYTVSKLQGENRDLTEFAQTNEVTMTNSVKKIIKQTDFDKKTFDKIMKQQEESVKIKNPEYSKKEVDKTTRSRMRSRFTKELKEKYKANEMSKAEVIRQMKRTGLYTKQSSPYKTLKRWNKE